MAQNDGKVAVVTGGGTGLGRAAVLALAAEGFQVASLGRRADKLEQDRSAAIHPFACDVADRAAVDRTVAAILGRFGRIDVLVNNAGIFRLKRLEEITPEHIQEIFGANMFGTIHMTLACMDALKATQGAIVNVSSSIAHRPSDKGGSIYGATKGGIEAFTRVSARELARHKVRVNAICPSLMRSDAYTAGGTSQDEYDALLAKWADTYPLGRIGEPEDFANLVVFFATEKSGWITGTVQMLDGGRGLL